MGGHLSEMLITAKLPAAAFALGIARCLGLLQILPLSNRLGLTGMHRTIVAAALTMVMLPAILDQLRPADEASLRLLALTVKEGLIGFILGVAMAAPFWAAETAGELVDQQRGSQGAVTGDAAQAEQTGITATLLVLTISTIFIVSGGVHWLLDAIATSYRIWPAGDLLPHLQPQIALRLLALLDSVLRAGLLLASPLLAAMIFAVLSRALGSRFAPQLNVFDLAMTLKGLVTVVGLPVYAAFLIGYLRVGLAPLAHAGATIRALSGG